jgi:AraC-like DNA-binding protein
MEIEATFVRDIANSPRFEYSGGGVIAMHPRQGTWRTLPVSLVAQIEQGHVWVYRAGEDPYEVKAGEVCCLPPGVPHKIDNLWQGTNLSRWSHFNIFTMGSVDLMTLVDTPQVLTGKIAEKIGNLNEEMAILFSLEKPEFRHLMQRQMLGFQLMDIVFSASRANVQAQRLLPYMERLSPVLTYMHDNMLNPMTREELANLVNLSPTRFYALFKEAVGVSPTDYIQNVRMQQAQRLLLNSGVSVHDIARSCGYPNAFYFSRLFKRRFGISPLQYRKNIGITMSS